MANAIVLALLTTAAVAAPSPPASASPSASPSPSGSPTVLGTPPSSNTLDLIVFGSSLCLILIGLIAAFVARERRKSEQAVTDKDLEAARIFYGFWLIVGGLVLTLAVVIVTIDRFLPAGANLTDAIAIITAVTGVIGTPRVKMRWYR